MIARSWDTYWYDLGMLTLVFKCFGVTNTSVQNFAIRISSVKTVPKCLRKLKVFFNKFNIDVSSLLMSSLRVIVIFQKYFGNHEISYQIHLFAPLLNMRCCTPWYRLTVMTKPSYLEHVHEAPFCHLFSISWYQ